MFIKREQLPLFQTKKKPVTKKQLIIDNDGYNSDYVNDKESDDSEYNEDSEVSDNLNDEIVKMVRVMNIFYFHKSQVIVLYINNIHLSHVALVLLYNLKRSKTPAKWLHMNNFKIEIDDKLMDAIVIPSCKEHGHFVKLRRCYNTIGTPCYTTIYDVCLYSRHHKVKHDPKLK